MSLPWDRFQPEPAEPEPEPVEPEPVEPEPPAEYVPPPDKPAYEEPSHLPEKIRPEDDFGKILKDAFSEALREAQIGTKVKEGAKGYAKETWQAIREGEGVDILNPTITAETSKGKELIIADAKSRSWRTLVQGLAIDVTVAVIAVLAMLTDLDPFAKETWILIGALLIKSVVTAIVSYFMRLKITPTIKTPGEKMAIMPVPRPMIDKDSA